MAQLSLPTFNHMIGSYRELPPLHFATQHQILDAIIMNTTFKDQFFFKIVLVFGELQISFLKSLAYFIVVSL